MKDEMKKVTNNQLQCEIVQDLLPLYHDDVVNTVTKEAVKQHLDGCEDCTKEYEELCQELPQDNVDGNITKSKFNTMQKRLKKKQVIKTALIALATCILVILTGYVLLEVPIVSVSDEEFQVKAAYKVQRENQAYLILLYSEPNCYSPANWHMQSEQTGENTEAISANMKRPVIAFRENEIRGGISFDWIEIASDTNTVTFAGETIWSEEENGNEEIPEYVNLLNELQMSGKDYVLETGEGYIQIRYEQDGNFVRWDLDGNIIYEGFYDDESSRYFEGTVLGVDGNYMMVQPNSKYWLADEFDTIYVSMNTEEGQTPDDLKNVEIGEVVGVHFYGAIHKSGKYQINEVLNIVIGGEDSKQE